MLVDKLTWNIFEYYASFKVIQVLGEFKWCTNYTRMHRFLCSSPHDIVVLHVRSAFVFISSLYQIQNISLISFTKWNLVSCFMWEPPSSVLLYSDFSQPCASNMILLGLFYTLTKCFKIPYF